ncbi:FUSC family protein [Dyella japonica]|uniref:FUSC family protein n=2 Tax=Dyella japonica TaxID=231455 RepID=UPI000571E1D6|nr:FUSC family protein [Dyella japonica]
MSSVLDRSNALSWPQNAMEYWKADRGRLIHAAKTAVAVLLSAWLCMRLELLTPRTAMVSTVILMMHQQAGMVIARGFYRGIGMAVGSLAGLMLVTLFPQRPMPFLLALSAWVALCVWGASYYRNYQSYGFVLAGYATAITAVPAWSNPYGIFDSVVYTMSDVAIGVVCASAVSALLIPQHVVPALLQSGQRHFAHFLAFVRQALRGQLSPEAIDAAHIALVSERAQLESLRSAAVFEDPQLRLRNPIMIRLNREFLDASAGFHAIRQVRERMARLHRDDCWNALRALHDDFLGILTVPEGTPLLPLADIKAIHASIRAYVDGLPGRIQAQRETLAGMDDEGQELFATGAALLYFAARDFRDYLTDFIALREGGAASADHGSAKARPEHIVSTANHMAASAAALRAGIAVLAVASFWLASGWVGGASALVAVSITSALFAVVPQPAVASRHMFLGCLAGGVTAFLFNFFVLPRLDGFTLLAACMAPILMVGSYVNSFPSTAVLGLGFNIYFCFIGNLANPNVYDPTALLDTGFAMLLGIGTSALAFSVVLPYGSDWAMQSYLRQIRREVVRVACGSPLRDGLLLRFESGMRDFIIQLQSRASTRGGARSDFLGWAFAALELGRAIIQIRMDGANFAASLPSEWPAAQYAWQTSIAALFDQVTPERHAQALASTRAALQAIPRRNFVDTSPGTLACFRMRALLHATELSLLDDTLPLMPRAEAAS